ncbi:hypothetical protein BABINDRAFT_159889 [Babjeviella inositovora NRRL Y-12698]|uniref:F-box domain-containing protein n=1 Tax=Babjeviella inositovora NRRL Y-12698 TaxID=984486 RepID=A0A1E3QVD8_9ASCO|nr:uncharacterized protein BABINDRAFT_159889 [Babjeviella inositovora NRRL Y-12698]ODQ81621.1 hypothetical protein BABINDRAFT_159889 [Babjeviella inositovora NRRL Y-12698]
MSIVLDEEKFHNIQHLDVRDDINRITNRFLASETTVGDATEMDADSQALELYQRGIDRENQGKMADAIEYYRRALKLNTNVDRLYRGKLADESEIQTLEMQVGALRAHKKLDQKKIDRIDVDLLLETFQSLAISTKTRREGEELEEDIVSESPSPLLSLPDDVFLHILNLLIVEDTPAWFNFSMTCKKAASLGFHRSDCWRRLCWQTYPQQHYDEQSIELNGITRNQKTMVVNGWNGSWRDMYRQRPFIKFSGIYISVVNYYSEGGKSEGSSAWTNPIRMITYYRYFRFYSDGTVLKLLTSDEPNFVVPKFFRDSWARNGLEKVYLCEWRLSVDGCVTISGEGSVKKYRFVEELNIQHSGRMRHHKLGWISSYSENKENGERAFFSLKNEKPFSFSRVKSYSRI